jgi:hypothetical protein
LKIFIFDLEAIATLIIYKREAKGDRRLLAAGKNNAFMNYARIILRPSKCLAFFLVPAYKGCVLRALSFVSPVGSTIAFNAEEIWLLTSARVRK